MDRRWKQGQEIAEARRHDVNETADAREVREEEAERKVDAKAVVVAADSKQSWRRDVFVGFLLMGLLAVGVNFKGMVDRTSDLRDGCLRDGIRTQVQYDSLIKDGRKELARRLENATDGYTLLPGSTVRVDCDAEYPHPWPLGVIRSHER